MTELHVFTEPQDGAHYQELAEMAHAAEEWGFAGFFRSDHYLAIRRQPGLPGPTDAWVTLAALARETSRVRLGTLMTSATFRLPGSLAIQVAQVDQMSGGRVDLGIGAGWYATEHSVRGIPFPPAPERFERLEEQLEILTGLWATEPGSDFAYPGRHYQLAPGPALPRPWQPGGPPILIGGGGPRRTPELAARFAAEFNAPFTSLEQTDRLFEGVRSACRARGRDPEGLRLSVVLTVCCGRDRAELERRAATSGLDPEELDRTGASGTPDRLRERIAAYAGLGCRRVYLQLLDLHDLDQLRLLASEVLPAFA